MSYMKYLIKSFILFIFSINSINADCSDLSYDECIYWGGYCEWNEETNMCQEIGGGGDDTEYGPYEISFINESNGLRNGPDYLDGVLYYPIDGEPPFRSVVLTPGWDSDGSSMSTWGEFYASHGILAMTIGPNNQVDDTHEQRADGLLDAITTIKQENWRTDSPLLGLIDTNRFIVAGYSMGGGASQIALTLENSNNSQSIVAGIALNPTIIIYDCDNCPPESAEGCWCFLPEHMIHETPTLIIAGQNEIDELPSYEGALGQDMYAHTPETTMKMLYEISGGSHGSAAFPSGDVLEKTLFWAKYHLLEDVSYCDSLLNVPSDASQFLTTLDCNVVNVYDLNDDGIVDGEDLDYLVISIINDNALSILGDLNYDNSIDILDLLTLSDYLQ